MAKPRVSIVMPLYNGEKYLCQAIDSVLSQSFSDFELCIVNDGSTDRSAAIIRSYNDSRIVLLEREHHGLIASLNEGLASAQGELIARQDADDISYPERIEIQVEHLAKHPETALVGTRAFVIDGTGQPRGIEAVPVNQIREAFWSRTPFVHGSAMLRRTALKEVDRWYDDQMQHIEDLDFFWRLADRFPVANIERPLYGWRLDGESVSSKNFAEQARKACALRMMRQRQISWGDALALASRKDRLWQARAMAHGGTVQLLNGNRNAALSAYFAALAAYPWYPASWIKAVVAMISPSLLLRLLGMQPIAKQL